MSRIYIGNLPLDIRESELDDLFYKYGKIREIDLKTPARPPAFAFISYDDYRDAEDAVRGRDGYNFDGYRLRVEMAKGDRRGGGGGGRGFDDRREPRRGGGGGRRTEYGVVVSNLPRGCSWQDLKDFMRKAGDVVFSDVDKYGDGIVEFSNRDDMEYAVRTLDDTEFKNYNDSAYIRVKYASGGGGGGGSKRRDGDRDAAPRDDDRRGGRGGSSRDDDRDRSRDRDSGGRDRDIPAGSDDRRGRAASDDYDDDRDDRAHDKKKASRSPSPLPRARSDDEEEEGRSGGGAAVKRSPSPKGTAGDDEEVDNAASDAGKDDQEED